MDVEEELTKLEDLFKNGFVLEDEYKARKAELSDVSMTDATSEKESPVVQQPALPRVKFETALDYLDTLKRECPPLMYTKFLDIMKRFKSQELDTPGVIESVKTLWIGREHLIPGFNAFLPPGYKIEVPQAVNLPNLDLPQIIPATQIILPTQVIPPPKPGFDNAREYVKKVKTRFITDPNRYKTFLDILHMYHKGGHTIKDIYVKVTELFVGHGDLILEFTKFLPDPSVAVPASIAPSQSKSVDLKYLPPAMSAELKRFKQTGYVLVKKLFDKEEVDLLYAACRKDDRMTKNSFSVNDGEGGRARLALWNHPGDDIYGLVSRCERIVNRMEVFLGGEVYHYHSKLSFKEPKVGGAFAWHQDYGYWYQNGCLYPTMASCFVALDPCTKENGCLQILKGSHHMGRVEHTLTGGQTGADLARVAEIEKVLPLEYIEQEPGDALFFHCNILHRSDQNHSDQPRLSLICSYNAARNNPYKEHHHPRYTPLLKVNDAAIKQAGLHLSSDVSSFMDPSNDNTIDVKK